MLLQPASAGTSSGQHACCYSQSWGGLAGGTLRP